MRRSAPFHVNTKQASVTDGTGRKVTDGGTCAVCSGAAPLGRRPGARRREDPATRSLRRPAPSWSDCSRRGLRGTEFRDVRWTLSAATQKVHGTTGAASGFSGTTLNRPRNNRRRVSKGRKRPRNPERCEATDSRRKTVEGDSQRSKATEGSNARGRVKNRAKICPKKNFFLFNQDSIYGVKW